MGNQSIITEFRAPIAITLCYLLVFYGLVLNVLRVKNAVRREFEERGEAFDRYTTRDRRLLTADRCMLNMHEHMPAFLALFWLGSVFVRNTGVSVAGAAYVVTRLAYPFLVGSRVPSHLPLRLLVSTYSGYAILIYISGEIALAMVLG